MAGPYLGKDDKFHILGGCRTLYGGLDHAHSIVAGIDPDLEYSLAVVLSNVLVQVRM